MNALTRNLLVKDALPKKKEKKIQIIEIKHTSQFKCIIPFSKHTLYYFHTVHQTPKKRRKNNLKNTIRF